MRHDSKENNDREPVVFIVNILSTSVASIISRTATAPLDRVKLILQTRDLKPKYQNQPRLGITFTLMKTIVRKQGFLGLWRGNVMNIYKNLPSQALIFSVQGFYYRRLVSHRPAHQVTSNQVLLYSSIAGGAAAATTIASFYPIYLCQTIVSSHAGSLRKAKFSSLFGCARVIQKEFGPRGFYTGFLSVTASVTMNRSVYFGVYDFFKKLYDAESSIFRFAGGLMSTTVAGFVAYPMETIGRRMAVNSIHNQPSSFNDTIKQILTTYGFSGLYRGSLVNVLRSFGGALLLVLHDDIYEIMMKYYLTIHGR
uniref:ADP/ATP translocase n=1 Tax=Lygus hesperus TaxID=30085 RepID=A0A0A9XDG8_LYGHE